MNVTTFNDGFMGLLNSQMSQSAEYRIGERLREKFLTAPLFDVAVSIAYTEEAGAEYLEGKSTTFPMIEREWPFSIMRAALRVERVPDDQQRVWTREITAMGGVHFMAGHTEKGAVMFFRPQVNPRGWVFVLLLHANGTVEFAGIHDAKHGFLRPDEWYKVYYRDVPAEEISGKVGRAAAVVTLIFNSFVMSAMAPQTHIATVRPNKQGKSVQWTQARTHYTLITHGHPANRREVREGSQVAVDEKEELTRMAHNRRAHYRTLRAARFTYARGKTVFVRATWVGPKEWKDRGGRQIYHILEPMNGEEQR